MTVRPQFSVVVAAYQAEATIAEAVQSALDQTYPPLEVVVCDDGSTDGTVRELERFGDRVVMLNQPNSGEATARNAAIGVAKADWVAVLDADDVFLPTRLEAFAELLAAQPNLDILTTDAVLEIDGEPVRRCYDNTWTFESGDQRAAILERNFIFGLVAVRRTLLVEAGGYDENIRYATDWDCWIRLILAGARVGLVAEPLARYRLSSTSLSAHRAALLDGRATVLERTAANPSLTPVERAAVERRALDHRRHAVYAAAIEALTAGAPDARTRARIAAGTRGITATARLEALAAVAAPHLCGAILRRRQQRKGRSGPAGLTLPAD